MAGLAAARAQGRIGGRPTVMGPDKLAACADTIVAVLRLTGHSHLIRRP